MAAGVIHNRTDFRLALSYPHSFYSPLDRPGDMGPPDALTEDEEEEEEEREGEEEEEMEEEDLPGQIAGPEAWLEGVGVAPPSNAEVTCQLLHFADLISCDIQRYFGRKSKEEDPDACDIYEDRDGAFSGKSGRERYYADLVKMAQTGDQEDEDSPPHPLTPPGEPDCQVLRALCSRENIQTLGPLAELFDYGLRRFVRLGRQQRGDRRHTQIVPMCKRRLPPSFWTEPSPHPACLLSVSSTPDFSDLLANWTSESSHELQAAGRESPGELSRQTLDTGYSVS